MGRISSQLESLTENYALLIQVAHETQYKHTKLLFFLSSGSFNQLARRIYQFKQLERYRRNSFLEIQKLKKQQQSKKLQIIEKQSQQVELRADKKEEIEALDFSLVLQKKVKKQ